MSMQSDGLNENYIKKLNEIIEFFKAEREGNIYFLNYGIEEHKFNVNYVLSIFIILIGISNALLIADIQFKNTAILLLVVSLLILEYFIIAHVRSSKKRIENIVDESNKYNFIINHLHSLKTLPYEVDLSKLVDKMKHRYHLKTTPFVNEKYVSETWFEEVRDCLTEINKEILEKEKIGTRIVLKEHHLT
jgi:hypothetical protein